MNIEQVKKEWEEEYEIDDSVVSWLIDEVSRLTAANANLRATVRGKTMYHSDEDVNREMGMLRAKNEKLREALKWIANDANTGESGDAGIMADHARQALKEGM